MQDSKTKGKFKVAALFTGEKKTQTLTTRRLDWKHELKLEN